MKKNKKVNFFDFDYYFNHNLEEDPDLIELIKKYKFKEKQEKLKKFYKKLEENR